MIRRFPSSLVLSLLLAGGTLAAQSEGDAVEVLWKGRWYPAKVLETKPSQWFIGYDGFGKEWNEWVGQDRIRMPWAVGALIEVNWKGSWYKASILEAKGGKYKIHYDGYGPEWDEWVTPSRMRKRR